MIVIATVRASDVNFPLFLHVLGAMLLTGSLFTIALISFMSWRREGDTAGLTKLTFRTVIWAALPAYILMRVGAELIESKENLDDSNAVWLTIGFMTADAGALLILVSVILSIIGLKKLRSGHGRKLSRAAGIIAALLSVAYVITMWAMTTQPS